MNNIFRPDSDLYVYNKYYLNSEVSNLERKKLVSQSRQLKKALIKEFKIFLYVILKQLEELKQ